MGWTALVLLCLTSPATAQTFPPLSGRVVDQANIIPDAEEAALTQRLAALEQQTSRQLVVATISSLEGYDIADYGYRLGRQWQIGAANANNGILFLIAPNDRRVRVEVGYGLEGVVTDALSAQIIRDQVTPRFRANDYPGGIQAGTDALITQLQAPPEAAEQAVLEAQRARSSGGDEAPWWVVLLIVIAFFGVIGLVSAFGNTAKGRKYRRRSGWGSGPIIVWGSGGSSGSSWGGGGSSWGGGGGGGFSGGGGSFGGGGSSGSW